MKLQPDTSLAPLIRGLGPGWLQIEQQRFHSSVFLHSQRQPPVQAWTPDRFETLKDLDFQLDALDDCELLLFGSGRRLRFVPTTWTEAFWSKGIGFETMDTAAACRTYNVLASEGRKVAAWLLLET